MVTIADALLVLGSWPVRGQPSGGGGRPEHRFVRAQPGDIVDVDVQARNAFLSNRRFGSKYTLVGHALPGATQVRYRETNLFILPIGMVLSCFTFREREQGPNLRLIMT